MMHEMDFVKIKLKKKKKWINSQMWKDSYEN